jgi:hypothetical protein
MVGLAGRVAADVAVDDLAVQRRVEQVGRLVATQVVVDRRIDQGRELRPAPRVGRAERHRGGDVATGAVADDRDPVAIDAELLGPIDRVEEAREGVVERGREPRFPGASVVEREHLDPGGLGEERAEAVVCLDAADLPAAAVDEHGQSRAVGQPGRLIETRPPLAASAPHHQVPRGGVPQVVDRGRPL